MPRRKRVPQKLPALPPVPPVPLTAECFIVSSRATFDQVQVTVLLPTYAIVASTKSCYLFCALDFHVLSHIVLGCVTSGPELSSAEIHQ